MTVGYLMFAVAGLAHKWLRLCGTSIIKMVHKFLCNVVLGNESAIENVNLRRLV